MMSDVIIPPNIARSCSLEHGEFYGYCLTLSFSGISRTCIANRFMQRRQSTVGTGKPTIQHCILGISDTLAEFLAHLLTSNTCSQSINIMRIFRCNNESRELVCQTVHTMKRGVFGFLINVMQLTCLLTSMTSRYNIHYVWEWQAVFF